MMAERLTPASANAWFNWATDWFDVGTFEAAQWLGARSVGIAGGVSANSRLRADAEVRGARVGIPVFVPPIALSTDNAAMIGAAGLRRYRTGRVDGWEFNAEASLPLS